MPKPRRVNSYDLDKTRTLTFDQLVDAIADLDIAPDETLTIAIPTGPMSRKMTRLAVALAAAHRNRKFAIYDFKLNRTIVHDALGILIDFRGGAEC